MTTQSFDVWLGAKYPEHINSSYLLDSEVRLPDFRPYGG